jgi:predicted O-linked N-acetylglucosamine transferase (SPINDLY family)
MNLGQQAYQYFIEKDYKQAVNLYEQAIESEPQVVLHYWYLGVVLILQEKELEAQMTWSIPFAEGNPQQIHEWTEELVEILQTEAQRQKQLGENGIAWAIRQHIREIDSHHVNNLLHIIQLSPSLNSENKLPLLEVVQQFNSGETVKYDAELLLEVLEQVLEFYPLDESCFDFVQTCISRTNKPVNICIILCEKGSLFINYLPTDKAEKLCELCLQIAANNICILANFAQLYQNADKYQQGLKLAEKILSCSPTVVDEVATNYIIIRSLIQMGGHWQKAESSHEQYKSLLNTLIESDKHIEASHLIDLVTTVVFAPYFKDDPINDHKFRNKISSFCQYRIKQHYHQEFEFYQRTEKYKYSKKTHSPLKIGYISTCLRRHSVGWLSRWLFHYHDHKQFEIYAYSLDSTKDSLQSFFSEKACVFADLSETKEIAKIAKKIYEDEIDILIDLDSVTSGEVCGVMALKPAPIQASWLGSDASGLPAIDYFIADNYVLPQSADEYYASAIWRLPNSYIAVDGFEVGVPTLRKEQLNIPDDAVIYLSCQTAFKRHPKNTRLQIKIIKEVPNSYLLIKGQNDHQSMQKFFEEIAEEEGLDSSHLRFLSMVDSELTHRANLGIADVVLDTYPYNGATTTLETLWMGIPLVTRVGEQFAARNSYTMMINAGITEGIAWTDEEYIDWGIRLGKDEKLRQQVAWKLRQSRHSAPLWNAKQFTREMEDAYQQMWDIYSQY